MDYYDSDGQSDLDMQSDYTEDSDFSYDGAQAELAAEPQSRQVAYRVYNEQQLQEKKQEMLQTVQAILSISEGDALRVLRHCKWDVNRVNEEWFGDSDRMRDSIGLVDEAPSTSSRPAHDNKVTCQICFDEFKVSQMHAAPCKHYFCTDCWKGYVSSAISSGVSSLGLRCPLPDCKAAVPDTIIRRVSSTEEETKYSQYALRSFVEDSKQMVWCPAPGCEHAVEATTEVGQEAMDVLCRCGASFCFNCLEEAHRPVTCETVKTWLLKNSAESENANWILANTKPCPKCKRPIEKNQGCMHMVCSQCRNEFCWLCLGNWAEHGETTGGYYSCNKFEVARKKGVYDEETQQRENAKQALERYLHYYQRWAENDKARKAAAATKLSVQQKQLEELSELTATPTSQLKFVLDAWAQVVECRRILKWTYAYGYYNFAEAACEPAQKGKQNGKAQQDFFEYNQGQAEHYLEKLHGVVEQDLRSMLEEGKVEPHKWAKFRESLIGLTDVTRSHFEKLVQELEKGLDELEANYRAEGLHNAASGSSTEAAPVAAPSSSNGGTDYQGSNGEAGKAKPGKTGKGRSNSKRPRSHADPAGDSDTVMEGEDELRQLEAEAGYWMCKVCTAANIDLSSPECSVCGRPRQPAT